MPKQKNNAIDRENDDLDMPLLLGEEEKEPVKISFQNPPKLKRSRSLSEVLREMREERGANIDEDFGDFEASIV